MPKMKSSQAISEFEKGVHAQIVWCKPLETDFNTGYGVGVKYFEPI
jgi:Tfp pilus assembly protein PilZ